MAWWSKRWRAHPRRRWVVLVGATVVAIAVFVLVWFQPQKLFIDDRVSDPVPVASAGERGSRPAPVVARGTFRSLEHGTSGSVRVLDVGGGRRVVRLEDLDTSNGPDLYLYLSDNPADGPEQAFDDDPANLGKLKGNLGDQNYELPTGVDLDRLTTVVIWCDRFNAAFGAAELTEA